MHSIRFEYEYDLEGAVTLIGRAEDDQGETWVARHRIAPPFADSDASRQLARQNVVALLQKATE